jgi:hypothetical protein
MGQRRLDDDVFQVSIVGYVAELLCVVSFFLFAVAEMFASPYL